mgnify:CR=1 FL=1
MQNPTRVVDSRIDLPSNGKSVEPRRLRDHGVRISRRVQAVPPSGIRRYFDQVIETASYVDRYAVQLVATGPRGAYAIEGRWTTGTDPSLDLTPTTAFATLEGGAAARPTQSP